MGILAVWQQQHREHGSERNLLKACNFYIVLNLLFLNLNMSLVWKFYDRFLLLTHLCYLRIVISRFLSVVVSDFLSDTIDHNTSLMRDFLVDC